MARIETFGDACDMIAKQCILPLGIEKGERFRVSWSALGSRGLRNINTNRTLTVSSKDYGKFKMVYHHEETPPELKVSGKAMHR